MMRYLNFIFRIAIFIFGLVLCYVFYEGCQEKKQLNERGFAATAVIYKRGNFVRGKTIFRYEFEVDGKLYTGNFTGYDDWQCYPGDSIEIRYDPINPSNNKRVKKPVPVKRSDERSTIFWCTVVIIVTLVYRIYDYKNSSKHR